MLNKILNIFKPSSNEPMSIDEFWEIFTLYSTNEKEAENRINGRKKAYSKHFDECLKRAHTWDLWGAAFIIYGGCSDDSFTDFKGGLLLQGREVFEKVLNNPEYLVELSNKIDLESLQDNEFGGGESDEPSGEPWEEGNDDLKNRFPRLWSKFGESPVGFEDEDES